MERTTTSAKSGAISALNAALTIGPARCARAREQSFYVEWGAGTGAGVVTIETAPYEGYTGAWASLATKTWSAAGKIDHVAITGCHGALRARISTVVTGGTIVLHYVSN